MTRMDQLAFAHVLFLLFQMGEKRKTAKTFCLLLLLSSKVHMSKPRPCQSQPNGMVNIPTSDSVFIKLLQHSRAGRHKTRASQNKRTAWLFIRSADTTVGRLVLSLFWQDGQKPGDQHLANSHVQCGMFSQLSALRNVTGMLPKLNTMMVRSQQDLLSVGSVISQSGTGAFEGFLFRYL